MKKFTVMIVDDERMALEHLLHIYDWEGNGFEIVATAFNGKQAFLKFRELSPQIVITDIKMPFMDGIELIRQIRKLSSYTKILLLTAYGEFEYAKLAINQGVHDYLLKNEITEEILANKLAELREQLLSEDVTQNLILHRAATDYFNSPNGTPDEFFVEPVTRKLLGKHYYYLLLKGDMAISLSADPKRRFTPYYENQILSLCLSTPLADSSPTIACTATLHDNEIMLLVSLEEVSSASLRVKLNSFASQVQAQLSQQLNSSFSLFIFYKAMSIPEFHPLIGSFRTRMNSKYFYGAGKIYDLEDRALDPHHSGTMVDTTLLEQLLAKSDPDMVASCIDSIFDQLHLDYPALVATTQTFYFFLKKLHDTLPLSTSPADSAFLRDESLLLDAAGIRSWVKTSLQQYLKIREKQLELKYSREIVRAINYMQENYHNQDLKISLLAQHVGLSPARLSVVFKKETGQTINEFLTSFRIEKAKNLLDSGLYKVYEIAAMVGYGSGQYFSHLFYSVTGVYPVDYKRGGVN